MDSSAEQQHKSCELNHISVEELINLYKLGFKLIPLRNDSKTPNVRSTNDIYENSEYWSEKKLQSSDYLFRNVATVFGKNHIKDEDGKDLYLNEIDIDSESVFTRLNGNGKDLVDDLCKVTYAVKTKKMFGYRIFWFSHKQNNSIGTRDCKVGHEFEIKTDNRNGHSTLPPSVHRDDPNFRYKNIGQNVIAIRDDLYDDLVDLLSDFLIKKSPKSKNANKTFSESVSAAECSKITSDYNEIASIIAEAYSNGSRNDIIFDLSGFLYRQNLKLENAQSIVGHLCELTNDEEVLNRLQVVQNTYEKAMSGKLITGHNALFETLERIVGSNSAESVQPNLLTLYFVIFRAGVSYSKIINHIINIQKTDVTNVTM